MSKRPFDVKGSDVAECATARDTGGLALVAIRKTFERVTETFEIQLDANGRFVGFDLEFN